MGRGGTGAGGSKFDDKFLINTLCFDVGCFSLFMKCTCLGFN